jgi:hypothetical protein
MCLPRVASAASMDGFVKVPYSVIDNQFVVRCTLNGKPLTLLIDTGAAGTVIDRDVFNAAIPKAQQERPKGVPEKIDANDVKVTVLLAKNLTIGSFTIPSKPVAIYDFTHANTFARHFGAYSNNAHVVFDGLLGLDLLRGLNAVIDTTHQMIYFDPSRAKGGGRLDANISRYGFTRVPMSMIRGGNAVVPITLHGKPGQLIVDTGAGFTQLNYDFVRATGARVSPSTAFSTGVGMSVGLSVGNSGSAQLYIVETDQFKVGSFLFPKGHLGSVPKNFGANGFLGPDMLERGHAFLDFGSMSLFLK